MKDLDDYKPMLIPGYHVIDLEDGRISIQRWDDSFVLKGKSAKLAYTIASQLDGKKNLRQIADTTNISYPIVKQIITLFQESSLIVDGRKALDVDDPNFGAISTLSSIYEKDIEHFNHHVIQEKLKSKKISILGHPKLCENAKALLINQGVSSVFCHETTEDLTAFIKESARENHFIIVAFREPKFTILKDVNKLALQHTIPWIAGWIEHRRIIITPVFIPNKTACLQCLLLRQHSNYRNYEEAIALEVHLEDGAKIHKSAEQLSTSSIDSILCGITVTKSVDHIVGWLPSPPAPLLIELNTLGFRSQEHPVLRLPKCPACGLANIRQPIRPFKREGY